MANIAFIPVRGGSKSIPLKNIKPICGKPLVYWTIKACQDSDNIDRIIVATDSHEIRKVVAGFGMSKVELYDRDPQNAQDGSSTESVMLEYINQSSLKASDFLVLVQATSPLLRGADLDKGFEYLKSGEFDSVISGVITKRFFWDTAGPINYDYKNRPRRQDFPGTFMENGAFYINRVDRILADGNRLSGKIALCEMREESSLEIDEPMDWVLVEEILSREKTEGTSQIKLFMTDVDGVLTDGGMYYSEDGGEWKKFQTHDGKGLEILRKAGIQVGIITSENTKIVEKRARKLKVDHLFQGAGDSKFQIISRLLEEHGFSFEDLAYIGDDINDLELLTAAGVKACPANAMAKIKAIPGIIKLEKSGGQGAVREFVHYLMDNGLV